MALPLITDPRDLLLDSEGDLVVGTDLSFTRGIQAIVQSCRIALLMFKGEWFLDLDVGIPYWESILGEKPTRAIAAAKIAYRSELLSISGVIDVTKLDVVYANDTRTLNVTWQVLTAFGETPADSLSVAIGGA